MFEVERFTNRRDLAEAMDNGGRFYHLFSQAHDNIISRGELAKAAGVWASDQKAFLFLRLAVESLSTTDQDAVMGMLEPELRDKFQQAGPVTLKPSRVEAEGEAGRAVVLEGYLEFVEDKSQFGGFIYVPIVVGDVTTFSMIPIFDEYDVYHVFDEANRDSPSAVLAVSQGHAFPSDEKVRFGGFLRDLAYEDESLRTSNFYLDACYFTRLG